MTRGSSIVGGCKTGVEVLVGKAFLERGLGALPRRVLEVMVDAEGEINPGIEFSNRFGTTFDIEPLTRNELVLNALGPVRGSLSRGKVLGLVLGASFFLCRLVVDAWLEMED